MLMGIWTVFSCMCNGDYLPGQEQGHAELQHPTVHRDSRHETIIPEVNADTTPSLVEGLAPGAGAA